MVKPNSIYSLQSHLYFRSNSVCVRDKPNEVKVIDLGIIVNSSKDLEIKIGLAEGWEDNIFYFFCSIFMSYIFTTFVGPLL